MLRIPDLGVGLYIYFGWQHGWQVLAALDLFKLRTISNILNLEFYCHEYSVLCTSVIKVQWWSTLSKGDWFPWFLCKKCFLYPSCIIIIQVTKAWCIQILKISAEFIFQVKLDVSSIQSLQQHGIMNFWSAWLNNMIVACK